MRLLALSFLIGCVLAGTAAAQPLPAVETHGDARVLTGGFGTEERAAMTRRGNEFSVKLVLSRDPKGAFATGTVSVTRGGESVVPPAERGPWVLLDLPPGAYEIAASSMGETIRKEIRVDQGRVADVHVRFTTVEPEVRRETVPRKGTFGGNVSTTTRTEKSSESVSGSTP